MQGLELVPGRALVRRICLGALCAGLVASCGGGVDSGGTGAPASFASGPISGFGSVIVNDVHFDDRSAAVTDADGNVRSRLDLRLGMTTDVHGTPIGIDADGNDASTATSIVFGSAILGPLSASDTVARTLAVLGQTIDISASTVFDDSLVGGQAALLVGDIVEIYASFDVATTHYAATRIERKDSAATYRLRGIVSALDAGAKTFSIGATRISYAGLAAASVPATLADGRIVRVALALAPSGGVWAATDIVDALPSIPDGDDTQIKGLVSSFTLSTDFSVDGTPVDARFAQFPNGSSGLVLGARVEVRGAAAGGLLVATRVTLDTGGGDGGDDFDVRDVIASIDTTGQTFVAHGVTVSYAGTVDFRNGTAADLAVGRTIEARGSLSADGTRLQATRITFRD
jgi:hypothetical protein